MTMGEFSGLAALVTGGASGIGQATATLLHARGAQVAVLDLDPTAAPQGTVGIKADVADDTQVAAAVGQAVDQFGRLDILVNNAGISAIGDVTQNTDDEWLSVLNINVVGMVRVARHAVPHLRRSPAAAIVNTCSIVAWAGLQKRALYSASKGAVYALTLAMAADHLREGIRVNAVAPGTADTPWVRRLLDRTQDPEAELAALNARQPMGRMITAEEVAHAIAYLASPLSTGMAGTVLAVDGGMHGLRLRPPTQHDSRY
jgi:NAD(P)-dependent dehydrogenase (short-subunit alcohol dehydrogenase family)